MTDNNPFHVHESKPWFQPEAGWLVDAPKNLLFPRITLYEMFSQAVAQYGDRPAMWFLNQFMSYAEMEEHVERLANGFHRLGLRKGDVVAIALPNSFQYVVTYYACAKLGLIPAGVNPTYMPAEVLHVLQQVNARTIVILDVLYQSLLAPISHQHSMDHVVVTNIVDLLNISYLKKWLGKKLRRIPSAKAPSGSNSFLDLLNTHVQSFRADVDPRDIATYVMTGGTTGIPKAAVLTHFNCVSNALQIGHWLGTDPAGACVVGILPLFHSFGMTAVMNTAIRNGIYMMLFPKPPTTREMLQTICEI